ncbi:Signal transduction histidine kinase [Filimonas lacunae]|uniref:histidine kinase n=1 Tax=Filimonas lacunae TaxID=477680 RepID=A0A173MC74_9BACT|nr:sensor histidine kinase [Filimonas lacunae]BAV05184.1 sensor histidine kinase [Filimonas lacunae]SIT22749.1 Signal transduction histidine kinase [Filimonas lacunae]
MPIKTALLCFALFFPFAVIQARDVQVIQLTQQQNNVLGMPFTESFIDYSGQLKLESVREPFYADKFVRTGEKILSYGFLNGVVWIHGAVANTSGSNAYLLLEYSNIDTVDLFYYHKGRLHTVEAGSHRPLERNAFPAAGYSFLLPAPDSSGKPLEFWLRVRSGNSVIIPLTAVTAEGLWGSYVRMYGAELIYGGIILALFFYNLSLYRWVKERSYLYYIGYLSALGAYVLLYLRGLRVFMGQGVADFICQYGVSLVAIAYMFGISFAISFLKGKIYAPKLTKVLQVINWFMCITLITCFTGHRAAAIHQEEILSLVTPILIIILSISVYQKKYKPAFYFLLAWSILLLVIVFFAASVLGLFKVQTWTLQAISIGSGVEVILLSFTLGFRYLLLKRETIHLITQHNVLLEQQVKERTSELQDAMERLSAGNAVKNQLLGIVSHDFKTPVSNLRWLMEQAQSGNNSTERLGKLQKEIDTELNRIAFTMDNILHWSLTQMDKIEPKAESIDLKQLVQEVLNDNRVAAKKKNIVLTATVVEGVCVHADIGQLRLVLLNLLHNAIKFTHAGGEVTAGAAWSLDSGRVELYVADTGVGMTQEDVNRLMDAGSFYSRQGTSHEKGTGMGIKLCKEFIEANGGILKVKSELNEGAYFYFSLPVCK